MNLVIIQTQFEGFHFYPQAPEEVNFLKYPHRHMFHIRAEIEVTHTDRELEIIMVKRNIDKYFLYKEFGRMSCEEIAYDLQNWLKMEYPLSKDYSRTRIVNIQVLEDGENGACIIDPLTYALYHLKNELVPPLQNANEESLFAMIDEEENVQSYEYEGESIYLWDVLEDITELDKQFGLDKDMDLNTSNLMFMANALAGEVGELCNYVKKIVRDGESDQLWKDFDFEIVDVMIYLGKLIKLAGTDFDTAWDEKHNELKGRYNAGKKHLSYSDRKLDRGV